MLAAGWRVAGQCARLIIYLPPDNKLPRCLSPCAVEGLGLVEAWQQVGGQYKCRLPVPARQCMQRCSCHTRNGMHQKLFPNSPIAPSLQVGAPKAHAYS